MINRDELVQIGQFGKPHGIKGEISIVIADSIHHTQLTIRHPHFLICEIDGILVPFRVENYRIVSNSTAYIQLKNINSDKEARILANKEVFSPKKNVKKNIEDDSFTWDYFIGFTLTDERIGKIGRIVDVDTTTINTLFIVERENVITGLTRNPLTTEEILIPAVEEFILRIDENREELVVALPEGLVG